MKWKLTPALTVAVALGLALAGCGDDDDDDVVTPTTTQPEETETAEPDGPTSEVFLTEIEELVATFGTENPNCQSLLDAWERGWAELGPEAECRPVMGEFAEALSNLDSPPECVALSEILQLRAEAIAAADSERTEEAFLQPGSESDFAEAAEECGLATT